MTKLLLQAILLFLSSAVLIGAGGVVAQFGLDKWAEFRAYIDYKYRFFGHNPIERTAQPPEVVRVFLNALDRGKQSADHSLLAAFPELDERRLRQINDYTFRAFRDLWFIQHEWNSRNGRYFQGKTTMRNTPSFERNSAVQLGFGLTDQVDDWRDIGYNEAYAPVELECHVYEATTGHGFTCWARVAVAGATWQNQIHVGPEEYRNAGNFQWIQIEL